MFEFALNQIVRGMLFIVKMLENKNKSFICLLIFPMESSFQSKLLEVFNNK